MQFFPAMGAGPGQSFSAGFRGESQDTMPGLDFSGFLSREFEQPAPEASRPAEAAPLNDSGAPEGPPPAWDEAGAAREEWHDSQALEETPLDPAETLEKGSDARGGLGEPAAKAAELEDAQAGKVRDDVPGADASGGPVSDRASSPEAPPDVETPENGDHKVAVLKAELAQVARDASGLAAANPEVAARIEALHDLMRQFQNSAPVERKELAVALADRIKALKEVLARSAAGAKAASDGSGKAGVREGRVAVGGAATFHVAEQKSSVRLESEKGHQTAKSGEHVSGAGATGKPDVTERAADSGSKAVATAGGDGVVQKAGKYAVTDDAAGRPGVSRTQAHGDKGVDFVVVQGRVSQPKDAAPEATSEAKKQFPSAGQEVVPGVAESKRRDVRPERAQAQHDGASREAAKNGASAAGMADRGLKARETLDAQSQALQTDSPHSGDGRIRESTVTADTGGDRQRQDARNGFFGPRAEEKAAPTRSGSGMSGKVITETDTQILGTGLNSQPTVAGSRLETPVSARSAEVYRQVESGAFRNLGQGVRQLVLHLDPADLGQVSVILRVKGKEVQAVLRATTQEASQALGEQMSQLRTQLESQGLKVGKLEVQTQMADSQEQSQWQGAEQHNRFQENRELALSAQRWRNMERVDGSLVRDVQNAPQREKLSSNGLDIFA